MIAKNSNLTPAVCNIYYVPVEDVTSIESGTDRFHKVVTFKSQKDWIGIYSTPGSTEFTEKPKENDAGDLFEQLIKFSFPGEDDGNMASIDAVINHPVLVKIELSCGNSKLIGAMDNPAKLSQSMQISSKSAGLQLEFLCMSPVRACWITIPD
jgi:hypothetical protein